MRPLYKTYINVSNSIARESGYANRADQWFSEYEDPPINRFESVMLDLYKQIEPIYLQYFSYMRNKLRKVFGEDIVTKTGPIPTHLISTYSTDFVGSFDSFYKPYPNKSSTDVTDELNRQNYTVLKIAEVVEDYYKSMGLEGLPEDFWKNSQFVKPDDGRKVSCDTTAWDFRNSKYYRLLTCGEVDYKTMTDFVHEMGHLHYYYGFKDLPCCYKNAPNSGFDETVAETMILPFTSDKNLIRLGLKEETCEEDKEVVINNQYIQFQVTVALIPHALLTDLWRWNLFRGTIPENRYNQAFWDYCRQYQGIVVPVNRSEEYLDIANSIFIADNTQTISYLISFILEYQLYEGLCIAAGQYDPKNTKANPLHKCDLYGSKEAGKIWKDMYKIASSKPWTSSVEAITGTTKIDAGSLLRYYEPLHEWLIEENKKNDELIGWI